MCHDAHFTRERLEEEIARELLEEANVEEADAAEGDPAFLNEERETDVEILTDGGE
jgi:hypothetical protein